MKSLIGILNIMRIILTRFNKNDERIIGKLVFPSGWSCYVLEPTNSAIHAGRYALDLTVSERVKHGTLWSSDPEYRLPIVCDVPGRSGIRIHSGNTANDSVGCLLVGRSWKENTLYNSRQTLTALLNELKLPAELKIEEVWETET